MTHHRTSPTQYPLLPDGQPPDTHTGAQRLVYIDAGAHILGPYRYSLWRTWEREKPRLLWVMLNPSTADGQQDDPTIRRCVGFARAWGYGGISVVNLYALRATYPNDLRALAQCRVDPVGLLNDGTIRIRAQRAALIVCAWGCHPVVQTRMRTVYELLRAVKPLHCLGLTKENYPRHPLYVPKTTRPVEYAAWQPVQAVTR